MRRKGDHLNPVLFALLQQCRGLVTAEAIQEQNRPPFITEVSLAARHGWKELCVSPLSSPKNYLNASPQLMGTYLLKTMR
jgi:hypothetical protein